MNDKERVFPVQSLLRQLLSTNIAEDVEVSMRKTMIGVHRNLGLRLLALSLGLVPGLSQPAMAQASGALTVSTPNSSIVAGRVVFSTTNEQTTASKTVTIANNGSAPLTITGISTGNSAESVNGPSGTSTNYQQAGSFQLLNLPALPLVLSPGGSYSLSIAFAPQRVATVSSNDSPTHTINGENYATLTITSDDSANPSAKVQLAGLNAADYQGVNEPSIAEITRIFGFGTYIGNEKDYNPASIPMGEQIYTPYLLRADTSKSVLMWPLAAYSSPGTSPHGYTNFNAQAGSGGNSGFFYALPGGSNPNGGENQKLLPNITKDNGATILVPSTSNVGQNPTKAFNLVVDGTYTDAALNSPDDPINWRLFPLRDVNGRIIPNSWIGAVDLGNTLPTPSNNGKNYDFQDDFYLIANAKPSNSALNPFTAGPNPGSSSVKLFFQGPVSGTLADANGQGTGFTSTQRNKNDTFTSTPSYNPSLLRLDPTSGSGILYITTTSGSPSGTTNTLVNGLQLAFNGQSAPFTATGTLAGPLTQLTTPYQQGGIFLGPDQDNYIKLVAYAQGSGKVGIAFVQEKAAVATTLGTVTLSSPSTIKTLQLYLLANPSTATVTAAYRVISTSGSDSGQLNLPGSVTLFGADVGRYFDPRSKAGIIAYSTNAAAVQIAYENFQILQTAP
ncbi:hypothetical protein [Gloeobacter kilaueensis]|uniref:Uncharacterized protein n=1 Tax=Gloeobacter kilaueensis (strain ATCC BAA-2537 / CCAP 1431/1 / ULC 316 / JS1) TaxID=1183438 RepID=U5QC89_GLOK1|nr:hypothetical protein [Gloeobacter kilaueensis]AGY56527.1 hypothetical protein GKIL_0280 [Gloeobacter kilaueensis JS1]